MAEPTSTVSAGGIAAAVWLASMLPGVDAGALIGAFAGAVTFAVSAKNLGVPARLIYMVVSLVMGYLSVPVVADLTPLDEPAVAAFLVAVAIINVVLTANDRISKADVKAIWDALTSTWGSIFKRGS